MQRKRKEEKNLKIPVTTLDLTKNYQLLTGDTLNKNKKSKSITLTLEAYTSNGKSIGKDSKKITLKAYDETMTVAIEPQVASAVNSVDITAQISATVFTDGVEGDKRGGNISVHRIAYEIVNGNGEYVASNPIMCGNENGVENTLCSNTINNPDSQWGNVYATANSDSGYDFDYMTVSDVLGERTYTATSSGSLSGAYEPYNFDRTGTPIVIKSYFKKRLIPFRIETPQVHINYNPYATLPIDETPVPAPIVVGAVDGQMFPRGETLTLKLANIDEDLYYYCYDVATSTPGFCDDYDKGDEIIITFDNYDPNITPDNYDELNYGYKLYIWIIPHNRLIGATDKGTGTGTVQEKFANAQSVIDNLQNPVTSFNFMWNGKESVDMPGTAGYLEAVPAEDSFFKYWEISTGYINATTTIIRSSEYTLSDLMVLSEAPMYVNFVDPDWMRTIRIDAVFDLKATSTITVHKDSTSTGSGTINIDGEETSTKTVISGETVTIEAIPDADSEFGGWSGTCSGTACPPLDLSTKSIKVDNDKTIYATFNKKATSTDSNLKINSNGSGTGTTTSSVSSYTIGDTVTLTATPTAGSVFVGWTGCDVVSGNLCTVTVAAGSNVSADFSEATLMNVGYYNSMEIVPGTQYALTYSGQGSEMMFTINGESVLQSFITNNELVVIPQSQGWDCDNNSETTCSGPNGEYIVFKNYYTGALTKLVKYYPNGISLKTTQSRGTYSNSQSIVNTLIDLELGMAHPTVITLQKYLNSNGYIIETVSGQPGSLGYETNYFGEKTKQALIKYQKDKGVSPASGFYGPQTRRMMGM